LAKNIQDQNTDPPLATDSVPKPGANLATAEFYNYNAGVLFKPKIPIWEISESLAMEDVGIFYGNLVNFPANL
jgi:hypothetical protein